MAYVKNVLVIMSDQHDPRWMGAAGSDLVKTPHLDALARDGAHFTNAVSPSPICVPARAAFATGQHVHQVRCWDNAIAYDGTVPSWGHALQKAGIAVDSVGKLHYRDASPNGGFDHQHIPMHIFNGHGMVYGSIRDPLTEIPITRRMLGDHVGVGDSKYTKYDRASTDIAVDWIKAHGERGAPWALFVGLVAPHPPFIVPQRYMDMYPPEKLPPVKLDPAKGYARHPWVEIQERLWPHESMFHDEAERQRAQSAYFGLCSYLDDNVGRILSALEAAGAEDDTLVVYTSDHGENLGARGLWGKCNFYQESVGVPMVLRGPGVTTGTKSTCVSLIDVYPTILSAMGVEGIPGPARPGRSLLDIAAEADDPSRLVLSEYHAFGAPSGGFMVRDGRWKYCHYVGMPPELFDLRNDPEELHDLAMDPAHADTLFAMRRRLHEVCDPIAVDRLAKADQAALIEKFGGREAAAAVGNAAETPTPL